MRSQFAKTGDLVDEEDDDSPKRISRNYNISVKDTPKSDDSFDKNIKFDSQVLESEELEPQPETKFENFGVLSKKANIVPCKDTSQRSSEHEPKTDNDPKKTTSESESEGNRDEEREDIGEMTPRTVKRI